MKCRHGVPYIGGIFNFCTRCKYKGEKHEKHTIVDVVDFISSDASRGDDRPRDYCNGDRSGGGW